MQHSIKIPLNFLFWVLIGISMFLVYPSIGDSNESEAMVICGRNLSISDNVDLGGLNNLLDAVVVEVENTRVAYNHSMFSNQRIYAFGQCYDNQKPEDCIKCIRETRSNFNQCLPDRSGRVYLDHCYLRYDNYDFIGETINHRYDKVNCGSPPDHGDDDFMKDEFTRRVNIAMANLTAVALKNDNFAFVEDRGVEGIYAIAQCWKPINEAECRKCLLSARTSVTKRCLPSREGNALFAGCYMKYSTERFYNITADVVEENDDFKVGIVVISWVALFALLLLAFFGAHLGYMKVSLMKEAMNGNNGGTNNSKMNFKYEVLERATDSFDMSRKLGQGGAGSVYKGILPNGKIIAVKRLFFTNRQWVDEFFNEVNLIGGIQHKNLVKLLGCSIEGPESLLVYEYVPNKSLYQVLFDKTSDVILSWKQRFDVILGIAEGLAYLHGGCDVKIIHRDIKTSNILLDEYLVPKIADFGLARCVDPDRSHVSTGIAGTLGYMAPEYLVRGQLTEKADIYAFGVMVLEIACGRKNTIFTQGSNSVLHSVWKHYKADNITESVDSVLKSNLPIKEASNVLQIGLLCTQALSSLRPSMFEVVEMLKNENSEVPKPRQPPFLNASVLNVEDSFCFTGNTTGSIGKACSESSFYTIDSTTSFNRTQLKLKDTSINASG